MWKVYLQLQSLGILFKFLFHKLKITMGTTITTIGSFITEQTGTVGTTLILDTLTMEDSIETIATIAILFTIIVPLFIIIDRKKINIVKKLT